jgi:hypothetical protein
MKYLLYLLLGAGLVLSCDFPQGSSTDSTPEAELSQETAVEKAEFVSIDTDEALLATALMAAPEESRAACKVIGYNMAGEFVTFKEGTNEFICLADDPKKEGFNAACYHKSLDPFMARGRALKAEGKKAAEIFDLREEEVKAGKLSMGDTGATLHIYYGPEANYDPATGVVDKANYRYVVYMPFATAASTGLPESPIAQNHPWIMNPGTHRAHIMITPRREE